MAGVSAKLARWMVDPLAPPSVVRSLVIGGSAFDPYPLYVSRPPLDGGGVWYS